MVRHLRNLLTIPLLLVVPLLGFAYLNEPQSGSAPGGQESSGALQAMDPSGKRLIRFPLKHTNVKAEITGFLSRVNVTQEFENPFSERIEAVYTFPLPQNAAVDDMTMIVGERVVRGKILRREEAQAVYEAAKQGGQVASLLNQERPNIFTQSVANILPGEKVKISISYVETLKYEAGSYEFVFPMVVGPRYVPPSTQGEKGNEQSDSQHAEAQSRVNPPLIPAGMRSGHDVSLDISIDAGVPIDTLDAKSHPVDLQRLNAHAAHIRLKNGPVIPNKDFILKFDVAGKAINDALISHRSAKGGYFTLILQPPERIMPADVTARELVFVLDTSGSMEGFPIEKAKETMKLALASLNPSDTFNLITFAGDTHILFPAPVRATRQNMNKAQKFLDEAYGEGGTEMMKAVKAALEPTNSQKHVRVVCFMTDGYVSNDMEIISEIQKHPNARVFAFGIGSSVNRFLLDNMAEHGRGEVEYVSLNDDGSAAARRFHERVRNPLLTDISIEWSGLPVTDVYPKRIPDLFGAKPVIVTGRYTGAGRGVIRLKGKMGGHESVREISVEFPENELQHDVLPALWARSRINELVASDFVGTQNNGLKAETKESIVNLGLEFGLMTQFTSFVAVEEMIVTEGGQPKRIDVPVDVPEGVNQEMVDTVRVPSPQNLSGFYLPGGVVNQAVTVTAAPSPSKPSRGGGGGGGNVRYRRRAQVAGAGTGAAATVNAAPTVTVSALPSLEIQNAPQQVSKVHPLISALIDRLKKKDSTPAAEEASFVRDGKADIQVWLKDKNDQALADLKKLGFEVVLDPKSSKLVIGRIAIEKLEALAELESVIFVTLRSPAK